MKARPSKPEFAEKPLNAAGSLLLLVFSCAVMLAVTMRLIRANGSVLVSDIQHYAFTGLVLVGIVVAFQAGKHVKVEILSTSSWQKGGIFNTVWLISCAIAPMLSLLILVMPDVLASWAVMERSREFGGMPGYFLLKSLLPIFCLAMLVVAVGKIRNLMSDADR